MLGLDADSADYPGEVTTLKADSELVRDGLLALDYFAAGVPASIISAMALDDIKQALLLVQHHGSPYRRALLYRIDFILRSVLQRPSRSP